MVLADWCGREQDREQDRELALRPRELIIFFNQTSALCEHESAARVGSDKPAGAFEACAVKMSRRVEIRDSTCAKSVVRMLSSLS